MDIFFLSADVPLTKTYTKKGNNVEKSSYPTAAVICTQYQQKEKSENE